MKRSSIIVRWLLGSALVAAAGACTSAASSGAPSVPSNSAAAASLPAGFPIGTWVTTITAADLRAGGMSEAGAIRENAGTFTRTYSPDGTWTIVQASTEPVAMPVFRGTWRATGANELEETTTFPPQYAGDVVRFTWAMEGTNLRLDVVNPPDPILPIITEAHAWTPQ